MMPFLFFQWHQKSYAISTYDVFILLTYFAVLIGFHFFFRKKISLLTAFFMVTFVTITALIGGRLFHLVFERITPWTLQDLFSLNGMTFYGSMLGGTLGIFIVSQMLPLSLKLSVWEFSAFATALSYGILRIGCFLNGCCWGKLCEYPWAVMNFSDLSKMPYKGVPVHPVQLYDSFLGFFIFFWLWILKKKNFSQMDIILLNFLGLYASGRFVTEMFRGDSYRGMYFFFSTSQILSLFLILAIIFIYLHRSKRRHVDWLIPIFTLFLSGCLLPQKPNPKTWLSSSHTKTGIHIFESHKEKGRNLLFLASDQILQKNFQPLIRHYYPQDENLRLETLVWWRWTPYFESIYDKVLFLSPEQARFEIVKASLLWLEKQQKPFDVIFLTHGFLGFLSDGEFGHFLSWRELAELKGRLPHLRLVFLQSCFGSDLAPDFIKAGANEVIAFNDLNFNFLFIDQFLSYLRWFPENPSEAYRWASQNISWSMKNKWEYVLLLQEMKITADDYLAKTIMPLDFK